MLAEAPQETSSEDLDAGPHKGGRGTERLCAVSRTVRPVDELIRFVVGPQGVVPDLKRKLPGRGLWIGADRHTLKDAVTRNVFARGFKRELRVSQALVEETERLLLRAALDALSIAGKASQVVAGFAKVEAAIEREAIVGLIHASDAGADGVAKLAGALRQRPDADRVKLIKDFTTAQLDLALGRSNVVHAALLAGPANDTFLARLARLERFATGEAAEGTTPAQAPSKGRTGRGRERN
jgi:predicted RNA-binding protein YlxR (DUF448 family)